MTSRLTVVRPGLFCTVQDLGRPGYGSLGVARSGAADRGALREANSLLGNAPEDAALESTFGGIVVRAEGALLLAVTGAAAPMEIRAAGGERYPAAGGTVFELPDGAELFLGRPTAGLRNYVAVQGGVEVPPVLGSRSTDVLSGIGPPAVRAGDVFEVACAARSTPGTSHPENYVGLPSREPVGPQTIFLPLVLGPRDGLFSPQARQLLFEQKWTVTPQSNRIGLRLTGEKTLDRLHHSELPSEPMVPGAVQVPPSGQPLVFLPDHPATGGYPVVGVLTQAAQDLAGQVRPGTVVQFQLA